MRQISVHCCTWNLNGKSPTEDLLPWLLPDELPSECVTFFLKSACDCSTYHIPSSVAGRTSFLSRSKRSSL